MPAMRECPPDSELMKAWNAHKATDDYANSYKWATAAIEYAVLPEPKDPTANRATPDHYRRYVEGSLWASFLAGFAASGGQVSF